MNLPPAIDPAIDPVTTGEPAMADPHQVRPMRIGLGSAVFLVVMLGASALTMIRMALLAGLLPTAAFATYATITATGAFLGTVISFGAVETTVKAFPRLAEMGRIDLLRGESRRIFLLLARRAATGGGLALLIGYASGIVWVRQLGFAFLFSVTTAAMALLASMQRAKADSRSLAAGTLFRTVVIFVCVAVAAASVGSVPVILVIEVSATALVCVVSLRIFFPPIGTGVSVQGVAVASRRDGLAVFVAYSAVNVPFYLDRLYVSAVMGSERAAQYAVLALFLTAASLLVNTVAQRIGPDAIRMVHRDGNGHAAIRQVMRWIALTGIVWLAVIAVAALVFRSPWLPHGLARYQIETAMLIPVAVSGLLLNSALLEFLLIALDREAAFVRCAMLFLVAILIAAAAVQFMGLGLAAMIWAVAICRLLYVLAMLFALRR